MNRPESMDHPMSMSKFLTQKDMLQFLLKEREEIKKYVYELEDKYHDLCVKAQDL